MRYWWRTSLPCLALLVASVSVWPQGPVTPPSSASERTYSDTTDGLRLRLRDLLNTAKDHDTRELKSSIKQLEIPNYQDWFAKTFGEENGERIAENYGRNFADGDSYLETLLTQLAGEDGEFTVRRVRDALASRRTSDTEPPPPTVWRGPEDAFIVTWNNREFSASPRGRQIGTFVYLDGNFRLVSAFRSPVNSPGMSTYPNLKDPGKTADASNNLPDGGNDQAARHSGRGGVGYPSCVYCPGAEYSNAARKRHLEGSVVLQVIVQPDGSATDIQVVKSPDPELTRMAMEGVSRWRFNPARDANGVAVPVPLAIEVNFRLPK